MSADNGIYILDTKGEHRLVFGQAIENLWWNPITQQDQTDPVWFNVYLQYKDSPVFKNKADCLMNADEMAKECYILEYGISTVIRTEFTWDQIKQKAKKFASELLDSHANKAENEYILAPARNLLAE
jgi:hypothetical protein